MKTEPARKAARALLALVYVPFGVFHMANPAAFAPIMPGWVPHPHAVIVFTGACEVLGGIGLLIPATRWWAGVMLAAYAVAVFPANLHHALDHVVVPGLPSSLWYHVPRLLFQPVFVWWALWAGRVIDWPFRHDDEFREGVAT